MFGSEYTQLKKIYKLQTSILSMKFHQILRQCHLMELAAFRGVSEHFELT